MRNASRAFVTLIGALLMASPIAVAQTGSGTSEVVELRLEGVVDPFVADYVRSGISSANDDGAGAVLVTIDTPGGLDSSMREIIQAILGSEVPVVCYVSPEGARAASAGAFILVSCPVAAMAPGTNVGAATPVGLDGAIASDKAVNDSIAYIRSLAEQRERNADWAESAVRDAASVSAERALELGVIDLITPSAETLLDEIDGRTVEVSGGSTATLETAAATLRREPIGAGVGFLHALLDPNLAFIFFWLGLLLVVIEFFLPHFGVAGVIGIVMLLLAVASFGMLPVRLVGVILLVGSIVFFILEAKVPGIGVFTLGGVVCLVLGGLLLFDGPGVSVSPLVIAPVAILVTLFFAFVVGAAMKLRYRSPASEPGDLAGKEGVVIAGPLAPAGLVRVAAEEWQAVSTGGTIAEGARVRVVGREGFRLDVEPVGTTPEPPEPPEPAASSSSEGSAL